MKEVKNPRKPLIYYYGIAVLVIFLFNLIVTPVLMNRQVKRSGLRYFYGNDRQKKYRKGRSR